MYPFYIKALILIVLLLLLFSFRAKISLFIYRDFYIFKLKYAVINTQIQNFIAIDESFKNISLFHIFYCFRLVIDIKLFFKKKNEDLIFNAKPIIKKIY